MSHETSEHLEKNFQRYQTNGFKPQDLEELVELFRLAKSSVGISLEIGDRLRKLALQSPAQQSQELH